MVRPRPRSTAKIRLLGGAAAVLLMAGCGSGSATAKQSASPGKSSDARAAFSDCLRKNGITVPSGRPSGRPSGGGGFQQQSMSPERQKAVEACRSLMPNGGGGFGQNNSAFQAFRACLKTHGVTLPDGRGQRPTGTPAPGATPAPGGQGAGGGPGNGLRGLKTSDPKVAAAVKTCRPLLPTGAPTPTPS